MVEVHLKQWLREGCLQYVYDLSGVSGVTGDAQWPMIARDATDLEAQLVAHNHPLPLLAERPPTHVPEHSGAVADAVGTGNPFETILDSPTEAGLRRGPTRGASPPAGSLR